MSMGLLSKIGIFAVMTMLPVVSACTQPNSPETLDGAARSHEYNLHQAQRVIDAAQAEIEQIKRRNSGRIALLQSCLERIAEIQAFIYPPETPERIRDEAILQTAQQVAMSIYQEITTERPRMLELNQLVEERKAYQQRIRTIYLPENNSASLSREAPLIREELEARQARLGELTKDRGVPSGAAEAFERLKGELRWPAEGKVVYPFGEFTHPQYDITIKNTGIDLQVGTRTIIRAVAAGELFYVGEIPGLNHTVILDHGGGYMTIYGNILEALETNSSVEAGAFIGEAIGSASSEHAIFHFALFKEETPLNPVLWLKPK